MRFQAQINGWGAPGVDQKSGLSCIDALVAGVRCVRYRGASRIIVCEHSRKQIDGGRAHAVELCKISIAMPEKTQHGHDAIDRVNEGLGRLQLPRGKQLPQGQQVSQQFYQCTRIAADVYAIGQDLPAQFIDQAAYVRAQVSGLSLHAKRRIVQGDNRLQARQSIPRLV
jgi:hypothetical protein